MMKRILLPMLLLVAQVVLHAAPKTFQVVSPDGNLQVDITVSQSVTYSVTFDGKQLIAPSQMSLTLEDGTVLGENSKYLRKLTGSVDETAKAPIYKKSSVRNNFNFLTLCFKGFNIEFRAYDEGAAYRFVSRYAYPIKVMSEKAEFNFSGDWKTFIPYVRKNGTLEVQFHNSFENVYTTTKLSEWESGHLAFLPLLVDAGDAKICITESDLFNYPGMYLLGEGGASLKGIFAPYPETWKNGGHNQLEELVTRRTDYLAKVPAENEFPWRLIGVARNDKDLLGSDLVWNTAKPADSSQDWSWVKPGKVAWEWWNNWNLYGVDFKAGINNRTYEYYIDFASQSNIEYVILDEGWAVNLKADLMQVIPEIDLPHLVSYAAQRNVGIILWAGCYAFDRDMENVCRHYSEMGVKGFKIDFMNADDAHMVDFYVRCAETCAKYKLLVDFHGAYKPTGLHKTYPNVLNHEGVYGLEQLKFGKNLTMPEYDVTIPFIRLFAGPMDYTQGAMLNASKRDFHPDNVSPMSQGTRCHQLAEYVIFDAPLSMLCDSPTHYMKEPECTALIASMPTVWDELFPLDGKVGEWVVEGRRSGDTWYVGALTNWDPRKLEVKLDFLPEGIYKAVIFKDGPNVVKTACDYQVESLTVRSGDTLKADLASGGGWFMKIEKLACGPSALKAYEKLISEAEKCLPARPLSVTEQGITPPSGDKHDYMSMGPYWWPDPSKPDGLPYIRKDGQVNPETRKMVAGINLSKTVSMVNTLSLAYYFSSEEKYAAKAAELLRVFFLNPETKMNPNLTFGQSIPGKCTGRGIGLIDTSKLGSMTENILLLDGSSSWTKSDKAEMQAWVKEFYTWMLESKIGLEEAVTKNNHATAYDKQICQYALYCGDVEIARNQILNVTKSRMNVQFPADASEPLELARTNSWGYSTMNLSLWMDLVRIAGGLGIDMWEWKNDKGVGLKDVVEWFFPFVLEGKPWVKKDISSNRGSAALDKAFRIYCAKFDKDLYPRLVEGLKSYCNDNYDFESSTNILTIKL